MLNDVASKYAFAVVYAIPSNMRSTVSLLIFIPAEGVHDGE